MKRLCVGARINWQEFVEQKLGFSFHSSESTYWAEGICYELSSGEVDSIESATGELHQMSLDLLKEIVDDEASLLEVGIPSVLFDMVKSSFQESDFYLNGRMDLAYDGVGPPKLLEYNADTPTALLEASVVQWQWLQEVLPKHDQFNSIHEHLIEHWKSLDSVPIHFT